MAWGGTSGTLPICTITPSTATPTTGVPLVLTANCSNAPVQYDWMECNYLLQSICSIMPACAATSSTCSVNTSNAGYARYSVDGINSAGTGPRVAVDVEWKQGAGGGGGGGGGGGAVGGTPDPIPNCSIFASDSAPLIGTSIVLSASCTGNPTNFAWSGVTCTGVQCQASSAVAGTADVFPHREQRNGRRCSVVHLGELARGGGHAVVHAFVDQFAAADRNHDHRLGVVHEQPDELRVDRLHVQQRELHRLGHGGRHQDLLRWSRATARVPDRRASIPVNWTAPATSPPRCTIGVSNPTPTVGQTITFTATCDGSPTGYVWTGCSSATQHLHGLVDGVGQPDLLRRGDQPVRHGWRGRPGGELAACRRWWRWRTCAASYSNVIRQGINWGDNSRMLSTSMGGFQANGVIALSFVVPSSPASYTTAGNTSFAEYGEPADGRAR